MSSTTDLTKAQLKLRFVSAGDDAFLSALALQSMGAAGAALALMPGYAQRLALSQRAQWAARFGEDGHQLILVEDEPIGRLWCADVGDEERCLVHMALLETWRGQGLGAKLLSEVIAQARHDRRRLWLHVACDNPAARLYLRLGFVCVWSDALNMRLELI